MKSFARSLLSAGLVAILALMWASPAFAQGATTSSITGTVTDPDGVPLRADRNPLHVLHPR